VDGPKRLNENLLRNILHVFPPPDQPGDMGDDPPLITFHQGTEGLALTALSVPNPLNFFGFLAW
jgi:hypothetical protein